MMSNVNFTGLHVEPSPENTKALSKFLTSDVVINAATRSFEKIDIKSGPHDVFLKTTYEKGEDAVTHQAENWFEMRVVDKNDHVLSAARFLDSDCSSDTDRANCKRNFEKLAELFEPPAPVASEAAKKIFDRFV